MKILLLTVLVCSCLLVAGNSNAQTLYAGAKAGWLLVDQPGFSNTSSGGVYGGMQFDPISIALGSFDLPLTVSAEGEFTSSLVDGDENGFFKQTNG